MSLTKKDLEDASKSTAKFMPALNVLARVLQPILRLGFLARPISRTRGGQVGAISRYAARGEHDRAADLAIEWLKDNRHRPPSTWKPSARDYWWLFMNFAAENLEICGDREKMEEVIEMARNGVEPFQGHYVARSNLAFSRWMYRAGDYQAAIEYAEIAAGADPAWAEPEFVLGWYCLILGGDAMTHLTRAVQKDHQLIFRIAKDPECRKHPHIIQQLKELSVDEILTVRDAPADRPH